MPASTPSARTFQSSDPTTSDNGTDRRIQQTTPTELVGNPTTTETTAPPVTLLNLSQRDSSRALENCFGKSQDNCTRISLHSTENYSTFNHNIRTLLLGSRREEAYTRLQTYLEQHASYNYWKRIDHSLYNSSIPNGACGWYTIAQLMNRYCTGKLLDFRNHDNIAIGCSYLRGVLDNTDNRGTITSAEYAIEFLHQFYLDPSTPFPACHELHGSLLVPLTSLPCALFYEQTTPREARMPDSSEEWLKLTSASCIADPSHEHLSLQQAHYLASDPNFCILSGHHYWVFPQLPQEADQLHSALLDLATAIWDTVNGISHSTILRPSQSGRAVTVSSSASPKCSTSGS